MTLENTFRPIQHRGDLDAYVTAAEVQYLKSNQFLHDLSEIQGNPRKHALLSVEVLKNFALDPLANHKKALSVPHDLFSEEDPDYWVNLGLDRLVFFIGAFVVPKNTPEAKAMKLEIQENLKSSRYKAAAMHRRLDRLSLRIRNRVTDRASTARNKAYGEMYAKFKQGHWIPLTPQELAQCDAARDAADVLAKGSTFERTAARVRFVADQTTSDYYKGQGFIGILARFAADSIQRIARQPLVELSEQAVTA
jgi:hypothetical protein